MDPVLYYFMLKHKKVSSTLQLPFPSIEGALKKHEFVITFHTIIKHTITNLFFIFKA